METVLMIVVIGGFVLNTILIKKLINEISLLKENMNKEDNSIKEESTKESKTEYTEWLKLAIDSKDKVQKMQILKNTFNRFTGEKEVYDCYIDHMKKEYGESINSNYKIALLDQIVSTTDIYLEFCDLSEWKKTAELRKEMTITLANLVQEEYQKKLDREVEKLDNYHSNVKEVISKGKYTNNELNMLSELEKELDREIIMREEILKNKYVAITSLLNRKLNDFKTIGTIDRNYNMKVLTKAEEVIRYFKDYENVLTKTKNIFKENDLDMNKITSLNKFDMDRLTSETIQYLMYVKSYIFGKLDAEEKLAFSKASLDVK